jgi:trigger factor
MLKEGDLSATVENISTTKKRLKIEIPSDIIEKEYTASLDNVRQRSRIPGFRPGKAPIPMIEKRFGNDIRADILDKLVPQYYSKAMKDAELVPVTLPEFEGTLELKRNAPLAFALTVEVRPQIDNLAYTGLKVEEIPCEVEEKEIDETIKGLQEGRAMYEVVDREVKEDDLLVIDYVKLDPSGAKELSSAKDQVMNLGNNLTPKGILEELIGRKKGDTVEIILPAVEGGEVKEGSKGDRLRITVKEVKEKKVPLIDDELAKDFGHESLESLKERVREGILKAKKEKAANEQKAKLLDRMIDAYDFEIPQSMLDRELETLVINEKHARKQPKELAEGAEGASQEEDKRLADELRPKAVRNSKATIILDTIAEKEKVSVSEEEMKTRIMMLARRLQSTPEAVINLFMTKDGSLENLKHSVRDEKVLDLILSKAEISKGV